MKVQAIRNSLAPTNIHQLKSFLGLQNFYARFLPNLSTILALLYSLVQKIQPWSWGPDQQHDSSKPSSNLNHPPFWFTTANRRTCCRCLSIWSWRSISHGMEDGSEKPIAYASRSLSAAEHQYFQLDKEVLDIIFAVTKFCQYLIGQHFTILSDHKPLTIISDHKALNYLFISEKPLPPMASSCIQWWLLLPVCMIILFSTNLEKLMRMWTLLATYRCLQHRQTLADRRCRIAVWMSWRSSTQHFWYSSLGWPWHCFGQGTKGGLHI